MLGMSLQVNLTKRVLIESTAGSGLRYCPVVFAKNGRVKPDTVWVNETEERDPEVRTTSNGIHRASANGSLWAAMLLRLRP